MSGIPSVSLANGVAMPALGLGTSPMDDAEAESAVAAALRAGYRLIDTAENYGNESGVGRGIRSSGVDRDEVFVTTKLNKTWHGEAEARQAFANSAERLDIERIDLLLIHWPNPRQDRYVDAWRGLIQLFEEGKVRAIGVSNFKPAHLDRLLDGTGVAPHVNQIQLDPRHSRADERRYERSPGRADDRRTGSTPLEDAGADRPPMACPARTDPDPENGEAGSDGREHRRVRFRARRRRPARAHGARRQGGACRGLRPVRSLRSIARRPSSS